MGPNPVAPMPGTILVLILDTLVYHDFLKNLCPERERTFQMDVCLETFLVACFFPLLLNDKRPFLLSVFFTGILLKPHTAVCTCWRVRCVLDNTDKSLRYGRG